MEPSRKNGRPPIDDDARRDAKTYIALPREQMQRAREIAHPESLSRWVSGLVAREIEAQDRRGASSLGQAVA
jgi:hypothetical protein